MDKSDTGKERKEEMDRLTAAGAAGAAAETVRRQSHCSPGLSRTDGSQSSQSGLKSGLLKR